MAEGKEVLVVRPCYPKAGEEIRFHPHSLLRLSVDGYRTRQVLCELANDTYRKERLLLRKPIAAERYSNQLRCYTFSNIRELMQQI